MKYQSTHTQTRDIGETEYMYLALLAQNWDCLPQETQQLMSDKYSKTLKTLEDKAPNVIRNIS